MGFCCCCINIKKNQRKKLFGLGLTILGIVLSILSAFTWTGNIITSRELKDYSYHTVSLYSNATILIALTLLILFVFEIPSFEFAPVIFLALVLIGISRGIASDLYFFALEKIQASTASILSLTELIFASILAFFFLKQTPTETELIGYALIMVSIVIIVLRKSDLRHFKRLITHMQKH